MQMRYRFMSLIILMLIVACGPAVPSETAPTQTPPPVLEAYPAAPTPPPPATDGYPAQPSTAPTQDPNSGAYPAPDGFVWMLRPLGIQCEEPDENNPADLSEAVAELTAAGISFGEAEITNLMVCSACGCPTSAHFHIQVAPDDTAAAKSLGWEQE